MNQRIAIVIGATGLVGSSLVKQLLNDDRFSTIRVLARRGSGIQHPKLEEHLINFDNPAEWQQLVKGDVLFSALGTTIKKAGSQQEQYKIDHDYQYNVAKAAADNGVPVYVLVSAAMASEKSMIFYSRMKGELERDSKQLPFQYIHILQPGILTGDRKENRSGEKISIALIRFLNRLGIARRQKPIDASIVARAMINVSFKSGNKINVYALLQVFKEAEVDIP